MMRPYSPRGATHRRSNGRLTRNGRLLLCLIVSAITLGAAWSWSHRSATPPPTSGTYATDAAAGDASASGNRRFHLDDSNAQRIAMPGSSTPCPACAACPIQRPCPTCVQTAHFDGTPPAPLLAALLTPWPGLLRATQAVELELYLDAHPHVGSCHEGRNLLSSTEHAHCAPLNCLHSPLTGQKIDLSNDIFSILTDQAYPADCPVPRGGQMALPAALAGLAEQTLLPAGAVQVSFIVTVHNSITIASRCLVELFRTAQEARSVEWMVVDDGSTESTEVLVGAAARMRALFGARVLLMRNTEAQGYGAANMRGIRAASGEFVALINSDLYVAPGWLWTLLHTFKDRPQAALVGPLMLGDNHLITEAGGAVWADASAGNYGRAENATPQFLYARNVDYVSAACVLVRRTAFLAVGGFDPIYGKGFYEDTDLSMSLVSAGHLVLVQPQAVVFHQEGTSLGTDTSILKKSLMGLNKSIFRRKWDARLASLHCPAGTPLDLAARRQQRPRLLWIDDLVPEPDHDSGSIRTMHMLRILLRLGYGVTFQATGDPMAGEVDRARPQRYIAQARFLGAEVLPALPSGKMPWDWLQWMGGRWSVGCPYDAVLVARRYIFEKWNSTIFEMCPNITIMYDTVDLHFLREARDQITKEAGGSLDFTRLQMSSVISTIDGLHERHPIRVKLAQDMGFIDESAVTMVVSEEEVHMLAHYRPDAKVFMVTNIHELEPLETECSGRSGVLFVANFQHTPNQQAVRFLLQDVLPATLAALPAAESAAFVVHIVGANIVPPDLRRLMDSTPQVVFHGYMPDETLRMLHFKVKAVVAPLLSGAGVKGKVNAALKLRVPVVLTPIAAEGMYLTDRINSLIAATAEDFGRAIADVVTDCALWQSLASAGYQTMQAHFSIAVAEQHMAAAFSAAGLHPPLAPSNARCMVPLPPPPLMELPALE